jgi:ketosteroid isomerase-like protein
MAAAMSSRRSRDAFAQVRAALCLVPAVLWGCAVPPAPHGDPRLEINAMLARSAAAWNRGDLAGFMNDYAHDSLTSYVTRGHVQYGWQPLYDRYQAAYFAPGKSRDSLTFDEVRVRPLTTEVALCTARFALHRGQRVIASGPFTLILAKHDDRCLIIHDHTYSHPT